MTARKVRPALGAPVTSDMSMRDVAAAIGTTTADMYRFIALADIPPDEFNRRLKQCAGMPTTAAILAAPVPARGRVERAAAIIKTMTDTERQQLASAIAEFDLAKGAAA